MVPAASVGLEREEREKENAMKNNMRSRCEYIVYVI
jgi:hypothetical protein